MPGSGLIVEPLGPTHDRAAFSCGNEALDRYLKTSANQDMKKKSSVVYVLTDESHVPILGYYTLSASSVILSSLPAELVDLLPKYPDVPVTLVGRLAIDSRYQGKGYGADLLMDALRNSFEASERVASAAVIVDAKEEEGTGFYRKYGFIPFPDRPRRLFLPMKTIEKAIRG